MPTRAVVLYTPSADVLTLAPQHFAAHQEHFTAFAQRGELLSIGTFGDVATQGAMAIFTTRAAAQAFVEADPFVLHDVVAAHEIREWDDVLAT